MVTGNMIISGKKKDRNGLAKCLSRSLSQLDFPYYLKECVAVLMGLYTCIRKIGAVSCAGFDFT